MGKFCLSAGLGEQHEAGQSCTLTSDVPSHIRGQTELTPLVLLWSLCPPGPVVPCPIGSLGCPLPWFHLSPSPSGVTGMLNAMVLLVPCIPCSSVLWEHMDAPSPCPHVPMSHGVTDMLIPLVPFVSLVFVSHLSPGPLLLGAITGILVPLVPFIPSSSCPLGSCGCLFP